MFKRFLVAVFVACFSASLLAKVADQHSHVSSAPQQKAHVHGLAELWLVQEGPVMELRLESPAMNIVGFEHVAASPEQRNSIKKARAILQSAENMFVFTGALCVAKHVEVDFSSVMQGGDFHEKTHHDKEHHPSKENHSEISATYRVECHQSAGLKSISVELFDFFPDIETLKVSIIAAGHQSGIKLTSNSNKIRLR